MKILVFNWRDILNPEAGGAEVHLHEIFTRIAQEADITLISSRFKEAPKSETVDGIKIIRVGNKFLFNFAALWHYMTRLKRANFDIIVDDINKVPLFTPLYVKKPVLAILHHINEKTLFKELPLPMALYIYFAEKLIPIFYKKAPFIVVSNSTKAELIGMGIPSANINLIYNAIEHGRFAPRTKSPQPQVVYFGRVKRYKQVDHLLQAFRLVKEQIPDARLVVAGKGDDYPRLERLIKKWHLESHIKLVGEVSEAEKIKILQRAWVFVTASMKEGWGITVIEANACGTPAIAYDVPGLRDCIRHGETGLLVPYGDIERLAKATVRLLGNSELREKLSLSAVNWASTFSWEKSADEFMQRMKSIVEASM
jgi:glycosyltransferase involved in cell wall biosynthesis